jgi:hypothetical protein
MVDSFEMNEKNLFYFISFTLFCVWQSTIYNNQINGTIPTQIETMAQLQGL